VDGTVQEILFNVVLLLISALVAYATQFIRKRMAQRDIETALLIAEIAVGAVEQISRHRGFSDKTRLAAAMTHAKRMAQRAGIVQTDEQWRALIEHAVGEMNRARDDLRGRDGTEHGQVG
jgi:hypothetical protein